MAQEYPQNQPPQQHPHYQPYPYGWPHQYSGYPEPRPNKKGVGGFQTCIIIAAVFSCLVLCGTGTVMVAVAGLSTVFIDQIIDEVAQVFPAIDSPNIINQDIIGTNTLTITSSQGGVVTDQTGAMLTIPPGAVPLMENGDSGTMVFTMEVDNTISPIMPEGFENAGDVYFLGPEGFNFNIPLTLALPIPENISADSGFMLSYFDTASNIWKLVPGVVNLENRTVSASVTHFSRWTTVYPTYRDWQNAFGGFIQVTNSHIYKSGRMTDPPGRLLPTTVTYGVCIDDFLFDDAETVLWWGGTYEGWRTMTVSDYYFPRGVQSPSPPPPQEFWLPAGTYTFSEIVMVSEVNINPNPLYTPAQIFYWRNLGALTIRPGDKLVYNNLSTLLGNTDLMVEGRPPCMGGTSTAVGTGDIQVTLTWQTNDDLDLHVTDPQGFTINYLSPTSPSGGSLDRDNECSSMSVGRPENIFWSLNNAPSGTYKVQVNYYGACEVEKPVNWTVRVVYKGKTETRTGTLTTESETQDVITFTIP